MPDRSHAENLALVHSLVAGKSEAGHYLQQVIEQTSDHIGLWHEKYVAAIVTKPLKQHLRWSLTLYLLAHGCDPRTYVRYLLAAGLLSDQSAQDDVAQILGKVYKGTALINGKPWKVEMMCGQGEEKYVAGFGAQDESQMIDVPLEDGTVMKRPFRNFALGNGPPTFSKMVEFGNTPQTPLSRDEAKVLGLGMQKEFAYGIAIAFLNGKHTPKRDLEHEAWADEQCKRLKFSIVPDAEEHLPEVGMPPPPPCVPRIMVNKTKTTRFILPTV